MKLERRFFLLRVPVRLALITLIFTAFSGCWISRPTAQKLTTSFPHTGEMLQSCNSCHDSARPRVPVGVSNFDHMNDGGTGDCVSCHFQPGITWAGGKLAHTPMPTTCITCHSGDRPAAGVLTPLGGSRNLYSHASQFNGLSDCVSCHISVQTNVGVTWAGGTFNHRNGSGQLITNTCSPCHASEAPTALVGGTQRGYVHSATQTECASCHNMVTANIGVRWSGGYFDHNGNNAASFTNCAPCHSTRKLHGGNNYYANRNCTDCHRSVVWPRPSTSGQYGGEFGPGD